LLPQQLEAATPQVVDGNFGRGFYAALAAAPEGRWSGPLESAYGQHLVNILARSAPGQPTLDAVRADVLEAWRREQAQLLRNAQFDALLARYRIVRSDGATE
jgi:parvulin-like peptidyl-prolyl isomerase